MKKTNLVYLCLLTLVIYSCGSQEKRGEIINLKTLNADRIEYFNIQNLADSSFYLALMEVGYTATHTEQCYVLVNKKDSARVLKFNFPNDLNVVGSVLENNVLFTKEAWNKTDKWLELKKVNDTSFYNWDTIPKGQNLFNKKGLYKYVDGRMVEYKDLSDSGIYFISAYTIGLVEKFNLAELKMYWH
jgi:hypothetical protein